MNIFHQFELLYLSKKYQIINLVIVSIACKKIKLRIFPFFSDEYLLEKYGTEIQPSDGVYYLSDLDYSTRQTVLNCLKTDQYKDIVDLENRMKLTDTELNFILFKQ